MADDEKDKERPTSQEVPAMTKQAFADEAEMLLAKVKAAGRNMLLTYLKKGAEAIETISAAAVALDDGNDKDKGKKRE